MGNGVDVEGQPHDDVAGHLVGGAAPAGGPARPSPLTPHVVLAVLTILAVGALVWSVSAAPPVARTILHQGAGNTAAVSSVQVEESISQVTGGHAAVLDSLVLRLQRPDRVEQVQQSTRTLVIGSKVYVSPNGGKNWYLDSGAAPVNVSLVFERVLAPMQVLQSASTVHMSGGQTLFRTEVSLAALESAMHLGLPVGGAPSTVAVTATIHDEFVTGFAAYVTVGGQHLLIQERYTHMNALPTLVAPLVTGG